MIESVLSCKEKVENKRKENKKKKKKKRKRKVEYNTCL